MYFISSDRRDQIFMRSNLQFVDVCCSFRCLNSYLMAGCVRNICAKSHWNLLILSKVTVDNVGSLFETQCIDNIKAGCQVGRSPSMLAVYSCVLIIADNTNKEQKREQKQSV